MHDSLTSLITELEQHARTMDEESLSVKEVLELPAFEGYHLLAGEKGLSNRCHHMTILETPEGVSWLEGNEILLTAGYAFTSNDSLKKNMMLEANRQGVSAIAIKEGRYFGEVYPELLEQADEFAIPLISLPYDLIYTRTISDFYNRLFFKKHEYILYLNTIYEKLLNLSFQDKNIQEILRTLSELTETDTILLSSHCQLIGHNLIHPMSEDDLTEVIQHIKQVRKNQSQMMPIINHKYNGYYLSLYPLESEGLLVGYVLILHEDFNDRLNRSTIEYGLPIIAMKLELQKGNEMSRNRVNRSLIEIMMNKKDLPDSFFQNIERDLSWTPEGKIASVCISYFEPDEKSLELLKNVTIAFVGRYFDDLYPLWIEGSNNLYIFSKFTSLIELEDFVGKCYRHLKQNLENSQVSVGVSNFHDSLRDIETMRNESFLATIFTDRGIIYFNSLDTIRLLYPLKNDSDVQTYYDNTIGKLEDYDLANESSLVNTLETFFRYNLKRNITAEKLFIHVETLRYRINKIEELTGYSLSDAEGLFALLLGVKLKSLMRLY